MKRALRVAAYLFTLCVVWYGFIVQAARLVLGHLAYRNGLPENWSWQDCLATW